MDEHAKAVFVATERGDVAQLRALLASGADANVRANQGLTPLMVAAQAGQAESAKTLVEFGASLVHRAETGATPLILAAMHGHLELAWWLFAAAVDTGNRDAIGEAFALMATTMAGDQSFVAGLLEAGVDADASAAAHRGSRPLHIAIDREDGALVAALLAAGASPHSVREGEHPPLIVAAYKGSLPIVQQLLDAGAPIAATAEDGTSALMAAVLGGNGEQVVDALIAAGADPNAAMNNGATAAAIAAELGQARMLALLASNGADVASPRADGVTPLMIAVSHEHADAVTALLAAHAPADAVAPRSGATALLMAAERGREDISSELIRHGATINAAAKDGARQSSRLRRVVTPALSRSFWPQAPTARPARLTDQRPSSLPRNPATRRSCRSCWRTAPM
jgi:ankyrin repeat protein